MTLFLASYLQPWVASLIVAGVLVIIVTLCACNKGERETRIQDFGIPGKLSSIAVDTIPQTTVDTRNGRPVSVLTENSASSDGKPRTVTERALPDIPRAVQQPSIDTDTDQTPDSGSECYATVTKREVTQNGSATGLIINHDPHAQTTPPSPINSSPLLDGAGTPSSEPSTSQELSAPQDLPKGHTYAQVHKGAHHPYSRLLDSGDSEPTDTYESTEESHPRDDHQEEVEDEAPDLSGGDSERPVSSAFIAGQAMAGNIPSAEIPYMTPPLAPAQALNPELSGQREIPYTVISVREPLDRVRMQTRHHFRRRQQSNQGSSTEEPPEGYYMEVPDEQTYAEIDSGQNSESESSTTYDLIEPRGTDFPPDPPTVESLKCVAKAHSRQASIASVSSFGSGAVGTAEGSTKDQPAEKCKKTVSPTRNSEENPSINLEDLYAKVHKKRIEGTLSVSGIEEVLRLDTDNSDDVFASARTSWSSTSRTPLPPVLPPSSSRLLNINRSLVRRHSAEPTYSESNGEPAEEPCYASVEKSKTEDPGYEQIKKVEPSYAKVKRGHKTNGAAEPGYEHIKRTHKDSDVDPGYERIKRETPQNSDSDPTYERIKRENTDSETEPGYELVRRNSYRDNSDPGYECVRNLDQSSSDPGYERVPTVGRSESDVVDPGYESVRRVKRETDRGDPDYECIPFARQDSETVDPGYESVGKAISSESEAADPGYEPVVFTKSIENGGYHERAVSYTSTSTVCFDNLISPSEEDANATNENSELKRRSFEMLPSYNNNFVCDKISLNVPYSDSSDVAPENFVTVRVKQRSDSESSVSYTASIVEVECGSRSHAGTTNGNRMSDENPDATSF